MAPWQFCVAVITAWVVVGAAPPGQPSCKEVRASFHTLQPGVRWAPESPVSEAFEIVIRHARNYTNTMFKNHYQNIASRTFKFVGEFFTDISLYVLGSDINVNDMVNGFFDSLFPVLYTHYINSGVEESVANMECLRLARRDTNAFGHYPKTIMTQVSKSLQASRVFLQALNLGIEVINTTDYLKFNKDCGRTLLKMWFCSHCQGLLVTRPCAGYCGAVMRGCLASVVEIDAHWKEYIASIERLAKEMHGIYDLEQVLLNLFSLIREAVLHVERNGGKLSTTVNKLCSSPKQRVSRSAHYPRKLHINKKVFKISQAEHEDTLSGKRRDFIMKLKTYSNFYGNLSVHVCNQSPAVQNNTSCWNGQEIVERYSHHTVRNGLKVHTNIQEGKNRGSEPVINQIIDKLNHINQLLKGMSTQRRKTAGRKTQEEEEESESGDCDDEDECDGGSGQSVLRLRNQLRFVPELDYDVDMDDVPFNKQVRNQQDQVGRETTNLQSGCANAALAHFLSIAILSYYLIRCL
ncbi:hypothetical protein FKM82_002447 [Ascaphus truei]